MSRADSSPPPNKPAAGTAKLSAPALAMRKLGLHRDIDLALHLPLRYEDETLLTPMGMLREGAVAQVEGLVRDSRVEARSRRQLIVRLEDASGELLLRFLNFYPAQQKQLAVGQRIRARGEVRGGFFGMEIVHPAFKAVEAGAPLPSALTPVYPTSASLPQAYLRKVVVSALARAPLDELLPADLLLPGQPALPSLLTLREALRFLHQPAPATALATLEDRSHPAWQRLKFDELLAQQLSQLQAQHERALLRAPSLKPLPGGGLPDRLLAALPFSLTPAQQRVVAEITADLARPHPDAADAAAVPMHRLLQGDVGSGKTVVAALAAAVAIDAGWQCALMAPTEILAEQHFRKLVSWLEPLGLTMAWLTGSRKGKGRKQMLELVASGAAQLVVGTHAVIQDDVVFKRLGLAVVDEQHRFGVAQRLALRGKLGVLPGNGCTDDNADVNENVSASVSANINADGVLAEPPAPLEPHLLMMTATPIPRTLAMTYYADLDVSTIDELPPGRTPVLTKVFADGRRDEVIARIRDEAARGRQVYWVCPLIDESEHLDLQNATATHAQLSEALPGIQVGLLHGRMAPAEKAAVMALFTAATLQVLVATTVIEVGVDVPNASLMVIEHAERFGLAQLHQLRGRVGRGAVASVCVLLYTAPLSATGKARLKAMVETTDGFEIARRDLDIRGPGEFMGARQSGDALLRFADLNEDDALLQRARALAPLWLARDPQAAMRHVDRWLGGGAEFLKA